MAGVWQAVLQATSPRDIVDGKVPGVEAMQAARDEVTGEVNKHARAPPKFSADGKLAMASIMFWALPLQHCCHRILNAMHKCLLFPSLQYFEVSCVCCSAAHQQTYSAE